MLKLSYDVGGPYHTPNFPMALYGLGEVHTARKDDRLALEAYTLAAAVWPQYVDALIAVGDLHARAGRGAAAEAGYNAALAAGPDDAMVGPGRYCSPSHRYEFRALVS